MTATTTPSLGELLRAAIDSRVAGLHVALPGEVVDYDASTQTATVRPTIRRVVYGRDEDRRLVEDLPAIPSVPVSFPRGGGFFVSFPIAAGDTGLLVFGDTDLGEWRRQGGVVDPGYSAPHGLSGAVFVPGLHTEAGKLADADASDMVLGQDGGLNIVVTGSQLQVGGTADAAALASKVDALVADFNAHTHAYNPGPGSTTPTATPVPTSSAAPSASSKLKVED